MWWRSSQWLCAPTPIQRKQSVRHVRRMLGIAGDYRQRRWKLFDSEEELPPHPHPSQYPDLADGRNRKLKEI